LFSVATSDQILAPFARESWIRWFDWHLLHGHRDDVNRWHHHHHDDNRNIGFIQQTMIIVNRYG